MAMFELLAAAAAGSVGLGCHPLVRLEKLWADPTQRWLIVGEDHGTNEEPEAFFNIVCQASAARIVTVAVEQAASEQPAISSFITSDGGQAARNRFLKSPIWYGNFRDGRSSKAYFLLFEKLRGLYRAGRITSVIAFQPSGAGDAADYEKNMAKALVTHSPKISLTIALVGGVHAMKIPVSFGGPAYLPMAGHLPAAQTRMIEIKGAGGQQWACQSPTDCGPEIVDQHKSHAVAGFTFTPDRRAPYSAFFGLGRPTSVSLPQVPIP